MGIRRDAIKGEKYGCLITLGIHKQCIVGKKKRMVRYEKVKCMKCGYEHFTERNSLFRGLAGCRKCSHITHGLGKTRFNMIYRHMRQRCLNPKNPWYKYYGGRGIKCLWGSFDEFMNDMYPSYLEHIKQYGEKETTIDRIDVNGNYCKENCRWATNIEQMNNTRRNTGVFALARELGLTTTKVDYWYRYKGLSLDEIKNKFGNKN